MLIFLAISFLLLLIITKLFLGFMLYKCIKTEQHGEFYWRTVSCFSMDVCFWWHRGEAEFFLGSCCKGPSGPWRNQPSLCSCTTSWISVTSPWELRVVCLFSRQVGRWAAERLHFLLWVCNWPEGQGKSEDTKQKHWEEVVESFSQRCCRVLDRTLVRLCSQVLTGSWATECWLNSGCQHQVRHYHVLFYCLSSALFLLQNLKLPLPLFVTSWDKG